MSSDVDRVMSELESLGYAPEHRSWQRGDMIVINYTIEIGSHAGEEVHLGIGFLETGYPEYPPHWILVSPPIEDGSHAGPAGTFIDNEGRTWLPMSRPPSDFWDSLAPEHQNMRTYLLRHVRRLWSQV